MAKRTQQIEVRRLFQLSQVVGDRHIIDVSVGPQLDLLLLTAEQLPDDRVESNKCSFPKLVGDHPNRYRIHYQENDQWQNVDLPETNENLHAVQPLGPDQWLLVRMRTKKNSDTIDRNAHVFRHDGEPVRSFHAGDGIADVQTTANRQIWVSFFDEGVFQGGGAPTLSEAGLVCLDSEGKCGFRFEKLWKDGVPTIADCYALNVCSNHEVWLYYYTDFPLVRIIKGKLSGLWLGVPVKGAHAFAVRGNRVLFAGGYEERGLLRLVTLDDMATKPLTPTNAGEPLEAFSARGRESHLFLTTAEAVFVVDVADLENR